MPMLIPFIAVLVLMLLAYAVIRTPADVIMYDITPSKHRGMASSIANLIGASFGVLGAVVGAILFDLNPGLPFWVVRFFLPSYYTRCLRITDRGRRAVSRYSENSH